MAIYLYDNPVEFYVYGCTTDGEFDGEKATKLGYNAAQLPIIEKFLADNPDQVKAALANIPDESRDTAPLEEPAEE